MKRRVSPTWGDRAGSRPRLLIEHPVPELALTDFVAFRDAGLEVAWCAGPSPDDPCPLVTGEGCALVARADVILCDLDIVDLAQCDARIAVDRAAEGTPVVHLPAETSVNGRVRLVRDALYRHRRETGGEDA